MAAFPEQKNTWSPLCLSSCVSKANTNISKERNFGLWNLPASDRRSNSLGQFPTRKISFQTCPRRCFISKSEYYTTQPHLNHVLQWTENELPEIKTVSEKPLNKILWALQYFQILEPLQICSIGIGKDLKYLVPCTFRLGNQNPSLLLLLESYSNRASNLSASFSLSREV